MNARFAVRSVKTKLLIAFLGLGLVPMATVGFLAYQRGTESLTEDAGNTQVTTAYNVADKIDRNYFERYGDVQAFALAAGRIRDWDKLRSLADEYMVAYGFYDLMIVADRAGKIQVVNAVDPTGKPLDTRTIMGADVSGEDWFQKGINGGIKPGETLTDAPARHDWTTALYGDEEIVTTFTAAIRDANGNIIGVWRNYASLQRVADGILDDARKAAKQASNADLVFTLVDSKGIKLHDDLSEEGELTANLATEWESARRAAAHELGYVRQVDAQTNTAYIAGFAASSQAFMPKYGWGVIVRVTEVQALARAHALRNAMLGVAGVAALLLIVVALWMAGTIARPISTTAQVMRSISEDGDLTKRLTATSQDELGDLADSFNSFVARLGDIAKGIRGSSANVATASRELSSVADDISSAAQSQASSLEQTAASMEQITATVKQNAENAGQASRLATTAREVADKGGRVVGDAVGAMSEINRSSKKIAEIITTIDEIAFQTNLLALNAAVEAARAGAQGRGFAVVAAEVRSLAARSASAAKEIKGLIQESSSKVELGTQLVNQSGQTLDEIVTSVKRVTDIVAEIAAASREQSVGIEEVNRAVSQMDQITQQNAAQNEELSATAGTLSGQARELDALVSWFKLEHGGVHTSGRAIEAPAGRAPRAMKRRGSESSGPVREQPAASAAATAEAELDGFVDF